MKLIRKIVLPFVILFFSMSSVVYAENDIERFVKMFDNAIENNNIEKILAMNAWVGLPEAQKTSIEKSFVDIASKGIISVDIEYIESGEDIVFNKKGVVFSPNLFPVAKILVNINTNQSFGGGYSYYIGQDSKGLKFSHVVLKSSEQGH